MQFAVFVYVLFTHTNIVFLFKHLPTEIVIFKSVCYQMNCFSGDSFSFLRANISPTFLISCEVQTRYSKILKYFEQHIRDHLSGSKVRIWIGSEYDAVYDFSCIASCNLTKTFTSLSFACHFYHKNQTLNFSNSQLVLFNQTAMI